MPETDEMRSSKKPKAVERLGVLADGEMRPEGSGRAFLEAVDR
jgi:hypothetical protein